MLFESTEISCSEAAEESISDVKGCVWSSPRPSGALSFWPSSINKAAVMSIRSCLAHILPTLVTQIDQVSQ